MTILPTGDVYACRRVAESKVGNALEDRLADLWMTSFEAYRSYEKFSKCASCRLLAFCRGCPAVSKGTCGSFYGPDPQCWPMKQADYFSKEELFMEQFMELLKKDILSAIIARGRWNGQILTPS